MPRRRKESYSIHSVENALDLLEALSEAEHDLRISQLSERLGLNKTSIFRLLATFENRGYVEKESTGKYRLGMSAFEMGQKLLSRMQLLRTARPVLEKLARECNEALYLVVPRDAQILLLDMVDTLQQVKIIPLLGNRYPLSGPSAGRVLLAFSADSRAACHEDELIELERELPKITEQGYCCDAGRFGEGIASLAVPLFNEREQVVGSLCMVGPEFRLTGTRIDNELLPRLRDAGVVISSQLGYVGYFIGQKR